MSYNVVFLYIKDFWLNLIFETLDDKKNNQKIDQKHKRRFQVSQFLSETSNSLIVGTSVKFWSKTLVPTIKLLEFSDKNWETWKRLLCFWSIFWLFFLSSKVSKMKFNQKSLIYKNTTLYDIDFYQKIRILRFFLRKFLLTVFRIFH